MLDLEKYVPDELNEDVSTQTVIPKIARDSALTAKIESAVSQIPTEHNVHLGDARELSFIDDNSVHLIVTSPPYWTLKEYRVSEGQLGYVADYEEFLEELNKVWTHCFRVLVPGGRLVCVVGDVCLSRRKNIAERLMGNYHSGYQLGFCRFTIKVQYDPIDETGDLGEQPSVMTEE